MALQASDPEALAATLLEADRAVVLTGLRLGGPESLDLTHVDGQWAERASLEAFLTDPARFWEYFYPTALSIAARRPGPAHDALARLERAGVLAALVTQAVDRLHTQGRQPRPGRGLRHRPHPALRALRGALRPARGGRPAGGRLRRGAALHHPRLRLPPAARGHALGRDRCRGRPSSGPGSWPPPPTPSSSSTRTCARRRSRCCPRCPLTRGVPLVLVGETPTQYDRYAHRVVRAPSARDHRPPSPT